MTVSEGQDVAVASRGLPGYAQLSNSASADVEEAPALPPRFARASAFWLLAAAAVCPLCCVAALVRWRARETPQAKVSPQSALTLDSQEWLVSVPVRDLGIAYFHWAPKGALVCDVGGLVKVGICEAVAAQVLPADRSMWFGYDDALPVGCSMLRNGNATTVHFNIAYSGDNDGSYSLLCSGQGTSTSTVTTTTTTTPQPLFARIVDELSGSHQQQQQQQLQEFVLVSDSSSRFNNFSNFSNSSGSNASASSSNTSEGMLSTSSSLPSTTPWAERPGQPEQPELVVLPTFSPACNYDVVWKHSANCFCFLTGQCRERFECIGIDLIECQRLRCHGTTSLEVNEGGASFRNVKDGGDILSIPKTPYRDLGHLKACNPDAGVLLAGLLEAGRRVFVNTTAGGQPPWVQCVHLPGWLSVEWLHVHTFIGAVPGERLPAEPPYATCRPANMNSLEAARQMLQTI